MASRNASFHEGVLAGVLFGPVKFAFALTLAFVAILLLAWTIDWVFVFKVWPEGVDRLKAILAADLALGIELATRQGVVPGAITGTANFLYGVVFRVTGIHDMGLRFAEGAALSMPDTIVRNTYIANREAIEVAMIGTQLLGVRLATLALMLPLLVLIYVVARGRRTDSACDPPCVRGKRVGEPISPSKASADRGGGHGCPHCPAFAGSHGLRTVWSAARRRCRRPCATAVGVLQEAPLTTSAPSVCCWPWWIPLSPVGRVGDAPDFGV